jgi:hypothetical protein
LKKRTKKLLFVQVRAVPAVSDRGKGAGVKVFWFFFSKKNTFFLRLSAPKMPHLTAT